MSNVNVDSQIIRDAMTICNKAIDMLRATQKQMQNKYREAGENWNDSKYQQLGNIVDECDSSINKTLRELEVCLMPLSAIEASIQEYESVNIVGESDYGYDGTGTPRTARGVSANNGGTQSFIAPRSLFSTQQGWRKNADGSSTFNVPESTGAALDSSQGKVDDFLGTCGLVSCVNVLRMANVYITEQEMVTYASTRNLCTIGESEFTNGGTTNSQRQDLLSNYGLETELREATIDNIAVAVREGRGVIASVYAGQLYNGSSNMRDFHAVTITSVTTDGNGEIIGFHICDSNERPSNFYTTAEVEEALTGRQLNVTTTIIR